MPSMSGSADERARRLHGYLHETAVGEEKQEMMTARKESGALLESAAATTAGFSFCVSFFSTLAGAIFTTGATTTWHEQLNLIRLASTTMPKMTTMMTLLMFYLTAAAQSDAAAIATWR